MRRARARTVRGWMRVGGRIGSAGILLAALAGAVGVPRGAARAGKSYFVAPAGRATNDGSRDAPWDLTSALAGVQNVVQPGDTVWLRAGTYTGDFRSALRGTPDRPIVVRQAIGQRAIVDGRVNAYGAYTVFWGFEIMQSRPLETAERGIDVRGPGHRFVNLVVHDVGGSGIGFWMEGVDAEIYGCIIYNNGFSSSLHHGIYAMNRDGRKSIVDNIVFNNFAYGIQVYGAGKQALRHFTIEGNVVFGNGSISAADRSKSNLIVGGTAIRADDVQIAHNVFLYDRQVRTPNVRLGYDPAVENGDVALSGNTIVGGDPVLQILRWHDVFVDDNVLAGPGDIVSLQAAPAGQASWRANTSYASASAERWRLGDVKLTFAEWAQAMGAAAPDQADAEPRAPRVIVRPNRYEPGRANVVILNWARASTVAADVSSVLNPGDEFELRSAQALFGRPLLSGRYAGGALDIPIRSTAPPVPTGRETATPPVTAPFFDVLVLRKMP